MLPLLTRHPVNWESFFSILLEAESWHIIRGAMADDFGVNLLKTIAAEMFYLCGLQTAREMFGKGYFSLGAGEKVAVDQATIAMIGGNFQMLTPEWLQGQKSQGSAGFQVQTAEPKAKQE
jgi:hypothetical protein